MGTHLRVLSESSPIDTNMAGFRWFSNIFFALDESSLSNGRVKDKCSLIERPAYIEILDSPLSMKPDISLSTTSKYQ